MKQLDPKAVWLFFFSVMFRWFFIFVFLGFWLTGFFSGLFGEKDGELSFYFLNWLWLIVPAILILIWIWAKLSYHFYLYELREDGFRKEHGVILKKYVTIPYDRIQTAGGITAGSYGAFSEGRLPGLPRQVAERIRDELIQRARQSKNQGL